MSGTMTSNQLHHSPANSMPPSPMKGARPRSAGAAAAAAANNPRSNVSGSLSSTPLPIAKGSHEFLRLLFTLLDPPLKYKAQVDLDTRGIDLRWLKRFNSGDRLPTLNTLETFRDDPGDVPPINSPRSAVVILRNGTTVEDLQMKPPSAFRGVNVTPDDAEVMSAHYEQRRTALLTSLREEYRELAHAMPLFDLLEDVSTVRHGGGSAHDAFGSPSHDRHRQIEYASRRRRERLEEINEEQRRKHEASERRREEALQRLERAREQRRLAAAARNSGNISPRTMEAHEELAAKVAAAAEKKLERAERKKHQRALQLEEQHEEARQKAMRNAHRMAKNRELLEQQRREQEQQRLAKEEAARQRREIVEREKAERNGQQLEHAEASRRAREEAREKARRHEEQLRQEAEARTERAADRLRAFASYKAQQLREAASMDAARR